MAQSGYITYDCFIMKGGPASKGEPNSKLGIGPRQLDRASCFLVGGAAALLAAPVWAKNSLY